MDQLVCRFHWRTGATVSFHLLLADRHQGLSTLGEAVRSVWSQCDCALRRGGCTGSVAGPRKSGGRATWRTDLQRIRVIGVADQRVTDVCDRLCVGLPGADVDPLSPKDLPQGLTLQSLLRLINQR